MQMDSTKYSMALLFLQLLINANYQMKSFKPELGQRHAINNKYYVHSGISKRINFKR